MQSSKKLVHPNASLLTFLLYHYLLALLRDSFELRKGHTLYNAISCYTSQ